VRVLLVESDPDLGDALTIALRLDGHEVEHLVALPDGLRALKAERWDVCIADVGRRPRRWPGPLDRFAARALAAHAPLVLTTVHAWVEDVHPRDLCAAAVLRKPFSRAMLRDAVAAATAAPSPAG
jgi:two-component system, OmpR family, response regulator